VTYAANIFRRSWREFLLLVVRFTPGLSRLFARFQLNLFKPTETRFFREVGLTRNPGFSQNTATAVVRFEEYFCFKVF
jgi:hypothetical protein